MSLNNVTVAGKLQRFVRALQAVHLSKTAAQVSGAQVFKSEYMILSPWAL